MKPLAWIMDLDGTLAVTKQWSHLLHDDVTANGRDFTKYHEAAAHAPASQKMISKIVYARDHGIKILYVTARGSEWRDQTLSWLSLRLRGHFTGNLFMRAEGDFRPDLEVKVDLVRPLMADYELAMAYEDQPAIAEAFRKLGIPITLVEVQ